MLKGLKEFVDGKAVFIFFRFLVAGYAMHMRNGPTTRHPTAHPL